MNLSKQSFCGCQLSAPASDNLKNRWFFKYIANAPLAVFWIFCCGITCKWMLFANTYVFSNWFTQIYLFIGIYVITLSMRAQSRLRLDFYVMFHYRKGVTVFVFTISCRLIYMLASQLFVQPSVQNDWHRTHIPNTNSFPIYSSGKQLTKQKSLPLLAYKNKFSQFPILSIFNSLLHFALGFGVMFLFSKTKTISMFAFDRMQLNYNSKIFIVITFKAGKNLSAHDIYTRTHRLIIRSMRAPQKQIEQLGQV